MSFLSGAPNYGEQASNYTDLMVKLTSFLNRNNQHVASAPIVSGGSGYSVGDYVEIDGGTVVAGLIAVAEVRAVASGVVTQLDVVSMGCYTGALAGTLTTSTATGSGTGLTVTATMGVNGYDILLDQVHDTTEREFIVQGEGMDAAQEIFFGARTYRNVTNDIYNWEILGFSGFNAGSDFFLQPGVTPVSGTSDLIGSSDLPLWDSNIPFWFYVNNQAVIIVCRVGTSYQTAYMGFGLPFGPLSLYPYPLTWSGMVNGGQGLRYSISDYTLSNFLNPFPGSSHFRWVDGNVYRLANTINGSGGQTELFGQVFPFNPNPNLLISDGNYSSSSLFFDSQDPKGWLRNLRDMGGDYPLLPVFTYMTNSFQSYLFQYDMAFWTTGFSLSSEDTLQQGGNKYRVFQNGSRNSQEEFFAVLEA